jgi:dipeptidyl aminopeptidase/acylaminoacyl peptidase
MMVLQPHEYVWSDEELWFPEWEFKGTPWSNPAMYDRWSPHKFVNNFNTPILVIHSDSTFEYHRRRMQLFTAVQRKGIDSKFLSFPMRGTGS